MVATKLILIHIVIPLDHQQGSPPIQRWWVEHIFQLVTYSHLHLFYLCFGVESVGCASKLFTGLGFELLNFRSDEHRGNANELKVRFGEMRVFGEEGINEIDADIEGLNMGGDTYFLRE